MRLNTVGFASQFAEAQVEIALRALDAGKDVMCQKPLALDVADAERIVERAEARGRKVAVQQQMRYEEGMLAARAMIERGWIGEVQTISFEVNIDTDLAALGLACRGAAAGDLLPLDPLHRHRPRLPGRTDLGVRQPVATARPEARR